MVTEAIVCPTCRAADTSKADLNGIHTCVYCGARYRLTGHRPVAMAAAQQGGRRNVAVVVGLGVLLGAAVLGRFLFVAPRGADRPRIAIAVPPTTVRNPVATARPAPEAPPEAPATATFEFTARASGYQTSFYVLGWVTNTSPYPIAKAQVIVVLLDDAGREVGTAHGYIGGNDLNPGEKTPIKVLVNKPPAFKDLKYEVVVRKATYRAERVAGLRVEPAAPKKAAFGDSWDLEGKVFHDGTVPARFVRVTVLGLDANGTLIGVADGYARGAQEVMQPGESGRFHVPAAFSGTAPAKFEYQVEASAATK